jgi:hypothetical protein
VTTGLTAVRRGPGRCPSGDILRHRAEVIL